MPTCGDRLLAERSMSPCDPMDTSGGAAPPAAAPALMGDASTLRCEPPGTPDCGADEESEAAVVPKRAPPPLAAALLPPPIAGASAGLDPRARYDCAVGLLPGLA